MKVTITENQERIILSDLLREEFDYNEKRLLVKKYLDDNFKKGNLNDVNQTECYVKIENGTPKKPLDKQGVFYDVQQRFRDILPKEERDKFLEDAIDKWINNKISKSGSSLNN